MTEAERKSLVEKILKFDIGEKHYTIAQIAEKYKLSESDIRALLDRYR